MECTGEIHQGAQALGYSFCPECGRQLGRVGADAAACSRAIHEQLMTRFCGYCQYLVRPFAAP